MKLRTYIASVCVGTLFALIIAGCASTQLTSSWKDPAYRGRLGKILVIGVAKIPTNKRLFEDEFVRQFKARGTDAIASYTVMPDDKQGDNNVIAATMREQGADAVLISSLISKKTVRTYVPGSGAHLTAYNGTWREYYTSGYQAVYNTGYIAEDEYALMETNLYDAANEKLIWGATSETELLSSNQDAVKSFIEVMVDAIGKQELLR